MQTERWSPEPNHLNGSTKSTSRPRTETTPTRIAVKVQPGASRDRLIGKTGDEWKIALTAPPVEGRANRACTEFLARLLGLPRSAVTLVHGETSRRKLIQIDGLFQARSKVSWATLRTTSRKQKSLARCRSCRKPSDN